MSEQTYANHVRWFPIVHFVILPLLFINLIYQSVRLYQEPSWDRGFWVVLCVVFILMVFASRLQALKAQDRVIRLEERLRFRELLPAQLAEQAYGLPRGNVIALRFASDGELTDIVNEIASGKLKSSKEIKMAIREWRADDHRV
jgi:hypothetical protein